MNLNPMNILLVDDTQIYLKILSRILVKKGYEVHQSLNGEVALKSSKNNPPDLILLDINMPNMDGYEVCRQLKSDPRTCEIPVIFISAIEDIEAKIQSFKEGGIDYITKPFQTEEVLARIETQLKLKQLQTQLKEQNNKLRQIAQREKLLSQISQRIRQSLDLKEILATTVEEVRTFLQVDRVVIARLNPDKTVTVVEESVICEYLSILNFKISDPGFQETYIDPSPKCHAIEDIEGSDLPPSLISLLAQLQVRSNLVVPILQRKPIELCQPNTQEIVNEPIGLTSCFQLYGLLIANQCSQVRRWLQSEINLLEQLSIQIGIALQQGQLYEQLSYQKEKTESLLLNILPKSIVQRLKDKPDIIADSFDDVSVMFADLVGFTNLSAQISPIELVKMLNQIFSKFDSLAEKHGLEKIKTIGDAYMVVGGLSIPNEKHLSSIADMALDMQQAIRQFQTCLGQTFQIRIGINSGPVVAGVIGANKFIYDLWGDTVNVASRMESTGLPSYIQVTEKAYEHLISNYKFEFRGLTQVKGKGEMRTYWLKSRV